MRKMQIIRRKMQATAVLLVLSVSFVCGCESELSPSGGSEVVEPAAVATAAIPATTPTAPEASVGAVLVKVNGQPVYMQPLYDALVDDYGLPLAKQFIADELVRQELVRRGISTDVTNEQTAAQTQKTLRMIFKFVDGSTPQQLDGLLEQFLAKRNITRRQWDITMRRNVRLSRLAGLRAKVSDEELQDGFLRRYDGKLSARHIQVPTLADAEKILKLIADGQDFAELAYKYSTNPDGKRGGWLPEISTQTAEHDVNPVLVQVVRSLKKTGDHSGAVQVGTNFHIVKLEKTILPENVKFDDVCDELRTIILLEKIRILQQEILQELFRKAKIEYIDRTISEKIEQGKK